MDIVDLLVSFLIIGGSIFFSFRKKKRATPDVITTWEEEPEESDIFTPFSEETFSYDKMLLEEKPQNPAKNEFSFSSLSQNNNGAIYQRIEEISAEDEFQDLENEVEIASSFSFSHDELKNGIIYSEILKRPYSE
ncbi:hypothetical protein LJB75_01505 [Bacteroidales bacterium OttesenSCG-928-L19]|nr:hypothetical protein [Bacteroidales bacterium OttesenSCG-928-L19]